MELADPLHVIWTGTARDVTGSLCLELVEQSPVFASMETYDERLAHLTSLIRLWCKQNNVDASAIEDISHLSLKNHRTGSPK